MAAPNGVVKSVAKKLKYYFEIKRLEDGFDLSDVHQPQLDHPPLKTRPALQNDGLHDRALKHYFTQPDVRAQITHMHRSPNSRGSLLGRQELQVRYMLDNYMKHYSFQNSTVPSHHSSKRCKSYAKYNGKLNRAKRPRNLIGGWPTLRSVPEQHVSPGEATRLVNSATKILVASNINVGRRPAANKYSWDFCKKRPSSTKPKTFKSADTERPRPLSAQPRLRSSTSSQSTVSTAESSFTEDKAPVRPQSAKYRSRTVINLAKEDTKEDVAIIRATQTASDFDVGSTHDRQLLEKFDKLEEEISDGPLSEYQVYVYTGTRIGSSTRAPIKLIMFGEKGRTKEFTLSNSMRHKIPFQKGKEDLFFLAAHHIGKLRKIQIGHDRPELSYAWYLEGVTVYDMAAKRIYQFPCERWLSGQECDKKTYRLIQVDREREFIDALDDQQTVTKESGIYSCTSAYQSPANENDSAMVRAEDNISTLVRPSGIDSTDSESSNLTSDTESEIGRKIPVDDQSSILHQNDEKKKESEPVRGPVITLHTATDAHQVDQIFMDAQSTSGQLNADFLDSSKNSESTSDEERKKRLAREREMERALLQGKSIHEAVRDADVDRVKDLLHNFPEMRDFKDESSWTPLHLAAARGNIELLRWLLTSEADVNVETTTGYNAMHIAAMNGHVNSMMLLQAMGASIFGLTTEKQSALHLAAKSGHLECVKWLVANRVSITSEDAFQRTALQLAEEFQHLACADFLRICLKELSNPRSTFALIQGQRSSQNGLSPIEEDCSFNSRTSSRTSEKVVKGQNIDFSDENDSKYQEEKSKQDRKELEEKRKLYKKQQDRQENQGLSFLDSIREDADVL